MSRSLSLWFLIVLLATLLTKGESCVAAHEFECKVSKRCIAAKYVCDKVYQCGPGDTSDEQECEHHDQSCQVGQVTCDDGACLEKHYECDGARDCSDGSDEFDERCNPQPKCGEEEFDCGPSDECISNNRTCNGFPDCINESDEANCPTVTPAFPGPVPELYFILHHQIRNTTVDASRYDFFKDGLNDPEALDFHMSKRMLYWSDNSDDKIYSLSLDNPGQIKTVVSGSIGKVAGLCVDWIHNYLFWTDDEKNTVERYDLTSNIRTTLVNTNLDTPRGIVVDPSDGPGYVYFGERGNSPQIEKMTVDGENRNVLVDDGDVVGDPNGLVIDFEESRLYWADSKDKRIMSCNLNGKDAKPVRSSLGHPFGLTLLGDWLFWTDWQEKSIIRMTKEGSYMTTVLNNLSPGTVKDIKILHPLRQQDSPNPHTSTTKATPKIDTSKNNVLPTANNIKSSLPAEPHPSSAVETHKNSDSSSNTGLIAGAVAGAVVVVLVLVIVGLYLFTRKRKGSTNITTTIDNPNYANTASQKKSNFPAATNGNSKNHEGTGV